MTRPAKILVITAAALLAIPVGCSLLLAASVVTSGLVTVQVHETKADGTNLYIPVPAGLIYLGLDVLPLLDRHGELARARHEVGEWGPAVRAVAQAIEDAPDAVLVDVRDHGETVKIVKRGRRILLDVHDHETDVHLPFPAHLLTRAARTFV